MSNKKQMNLWWFNELNQCLNEKDISKAIDYYDSMIDVKRRMSKLEGEDGKEDDLMELHYEMSHQKEDFNELVSKMVWSSEEIREYFVDEDFSMMERIWLIKKFVMLKYALATPESDICDGVYFVIPKGFKYSF